jgi:hypothetical protein
MPIIYIIVWLAIIGLLMWLVTTYIPMPDAIKKLIVVVVVVLVIIWLATTLLPLGGGPVVGPMFRR